MSIQPVFFLKAKNKLNQTIIATGLENPGAMASFQCVKRFNDLGTWQLALQDTQKSPSPFASTFLPDTSGNLQSGIVLHMNNQDGQGLQYVFSGPQTDVDVKVAPSGLRTITAIGNCENYWLKSRLALPVPGFPYDYLATALAVFLPATFEPNWHAIPENANLTRYYLLNETSGATATDSNGAANGTYTNVTSYNQPGLLDDPVACVKLNGTNGFISVPTAGLNSGSGTWSIVGWGMFPSLPGAASTMWGFGSNVNNEAIQLGISSGNFAYFNLEGSASMLSSETIIAGMPFMLALTYDGSILRGYFYQMQPGGPVGGQFAQQTVGSLAITYGSAFLGKTIVSTQFWGGYLGRCAWYNSVALSATSIANLFATGYSRQAFLAYDIFEQQQASAQLIYYTQRNASASVASGFPNYDVARPSATFTNYNGTQTARAIPTMTMAADPAVGSIISGVARNDKLLDLDAALALQSTPEIGFKLEQSGSGLLFTVFQPTDKTSVAVFSLDRKNLLEGYEWTYSAAKANHLVAGGSTPPASTSLADRLFGVGEDATSISQFGYVEDFLDYRAAQTGETLAQGIDAQLAQEKDAINFNGTIVGTDQLYFKGPSGKNWDLGDIVTVLADGQTFQETIREVEIDLEPGAIPVITAAIGTPVDAQVMQEMQTIQSNIAALKAAQSSLKTNF